MPSCDSCGASIAPDAAACDLCGTPTADAPTPSDGPTCATCGHTSPPGSRFCNECGAALAAAPATPPVADDAARERPSSAAGQKGLVIVGMGLATVVILYAMTLFAPRPEPAPAAPDTPEVGAAAPIPPGAPPLPDSLQTAADRFADEGTASGWYESGRYYLTAAFQSVQTDPTSSVRWARRAIEDFERSLEIEERPAVRVALAEAATFDPADPMRPIAELRAVLDADPGNLDATYLLAERRMMIGRVDSARVAFERVVAEAPPGSPVGQRAAEALARIAGTAAP